MSSVVRPLPGAAMSAWICPVADLRTVDDRALVEAFQAGNREAFDLIVERHRRSVYQVCYRFVRNHEDAADLAQDVFVRAFKGLRTFKGDAALGTWLYRVGVNVCLNRLALKRPRVEALEPDGARGQHEITGLQRPAAERRLFDFGLRLLHPGFARGGVCGAELGHLVVEFQIVGEDRGRGRRLAHRDAGLRS